VALWGPLLDRLNVVAEADRRGLRPIDPGVIDCDDQAEVGRLCGRR
jgi:hypothetical protein